MFQIIYLWRGKKCVHDFDFTDREEAEEVLEDYRANKWRAWIKPVEANETEDIAA